MRYSLLLVLLCPQFAFSQTTQRAASEAELRSIIASLEVQVATLRAQVSNLEARNAAMEKQLTGAGKPGDSKPQIMKLTGKISIGRFDDGKTEPSYLLRIVHDDMGEDKVAKAITFAGKTKTFKITEQGKEASSPFGAIAKDEEEALLPITAEQIKFVALDPDVQVHLDSHHDAAFLMAASALANDEPRRRLQEFYRKSVTKSETAQDPAVEVELRGTIATLKQENDALRAQLSQMLERNAEQQKPPALPKGGANATKPQIMELSKQLSIGRFDEGGAEPIYVLRVVHKDMSKDTKPKTIKIFTEGHDFTLTEIPREAADASPFGAVTSKGMEEALLPITAEQIRLIVAGKEIGVSLDGHQDNGFIIAASDLSQDEPRLKLREFYRKSVVKSETKKDG